MEEIDMSYENTRYYVWLADLGFVGTLVMMACVVALAWVQSGV